MSRLLVCPPDYFSIEYEINPWMRRSNAVNSDQAVRQWHHLMQVLEQDVGAVLERMKPVPGLPDLVFTANAGIVVGGKAVPSRFRYAERQKEEAYFEDWFRGQGYEVVTLDPGPLLRGSRGPLGISRHLVRWLSTTIGYPCVPDAQRLVSPRDHSTRTGRQAILSPRHLLVPLERR